jgi:hypothetical protein
MIEKTLGGYKFPDGTIQTTAATAGLSSIAHDSTLTGNGTLGSPLGVVVPLHVMAAIDFGGSIIKATNTSQSGNGIEGFGGAAGVSATGGNDSGIGFGGTGVSATGGNSTSGTAEVACLLKAASARACAAVMAHSPKGNLSISGNLSKGGGSFKIDHPLDPENKYLYHSFVESPDMMNIYNGNVATDANGDAVVEMPDYFEALNKEFRYQLTVIGTFAQAIVAEEISGNRFKIRTSAPNVKVSWQVTGVRHDAWANKNRIKVEVEKDDRERGSYLHPEVFNQPKERGIWWGTTSRNDAAPDAASRRARIGAKKSDGKKESMMTSTISAL